MEEFLGLLLLGLCTAAFCGAICARILDSRWPDLSTLTRLFLVSLAPVLVWVAFQALILPIILSDPAAHAGFVRQWRLYLWEVVLKQALKLWACGIFCAGLMVFFCEILKAMNAVFMGPRMSEVAIRKLLIWSEGSSRL